MKEMLARAQILADTFTGKWIGGLEAAVLRGALDALGRIETYPDYLIDQGVLEAIAAASGSVPRGAGKRSLYMVVDVGAGTTDFGLFTVVTPALKDDRPKIFEVPDTTVVLRQAGDTIDKILLRRILEQEGIESGDPEYDHVNSDLLLRIRFLKEDLFRNGIARYNLPTDSAGSVNAKSFLDDQRVKRFAAAIKEYFQKSLANAHPSWINGLKENGLNVVLTGGGSGLPMVRALGQGRIDVHGVKLACKLVPHPPDRLVDYYPDLETDYPQLAVSIGGAVEELPVRGTQFKELAVPFGTQPISSVEIQYKGS